MDIKGCECLSLKELQHIFECDKLSIKDAMPKMREFRDKHGFDDKTALRAFGVSKRIFGD